MPDKTPERYERSSMKLLKIMKSGFLEIIPPMIY